MPPLRILRLRLGIEPEAGKAAASKGKKVMTTANASVPTKSGSRYLQQLSKHWSHSLDVTFTTEQSRIVFPMDLRGASWPADALVTMTARAGALDVRIEASGPEHLAALKGVVASHLDRFAFREAPLAFDWR